MNSLTFCHVLDSQTAVEQILATDEMQQLRQLLDRWSPLVQRAQLLDEPEVQIEELEQLDGLLQVAFQRPGTKVVVPPSLDPLFHLAILADGLPARLAAAAGYADFHHILAENDGQPHFPTGSRYRDAGSAGCHLMPGFGDEVFVEPGCCIWAVPDAA